MIEKVLNIRHLHEKHFQHQQDLYSVFMEFRKPVEPAHEQTFNKTCATSEDSV